MKQNIKRFPIDFCFQLNSQEYHVLISQIVTSKRGRTRKLFFVFTEQSVAMLSSVLKSEKAVEVNIAIMRVFVMVARIIDSTKTLAEKIEEIKKEHENSNQIIEKHDKNIKEIFNIIKNKI